jgi:hypothetical protein
MHRSQANELYHKSKTCRDESEPQDPWNVHITFPHSKLDSWETTPDADLGKASDSWEVKKSFIAVTLAGLPRDDILIFMALSDERPENLIADLLIAWLHPVDRTLLCLSVAHLIGASFDKERAKEQTKAHKYCPNECHGKCVLLGSPSVD